MTGNTAPHPHLHVGGRVLAAIDASGYNDSVSHWAAWASARLDAPLEYLHVLIAIRRPRRSPTSAATSRWMPVRSCCRTWSRSARVAAG